MKQRRMLATIGILSSKPMIFVEYLGSEASRRLAIWTEAKA